MSTLYIKSQRIWTRSKGDTTIRTTVTGIFRSSYIRHITICPSLTQRDISGSGCTDAEHSDVIIPHSHGISIFIAYTVGICFH